MSFQSIRGFRDVLPPDAQRTVHFENGARKVLRLHGYHELRLPTLEYKDLFIKSTGETTDIVEKEMFELQDSGGRNLALRPEGTPGAVRAYLQHSLQQQGGRTKLFYIGNMFRAERPQAGRFREFTQIGAECFGNPHPASDAEVIHALALILRDAGLKDYSVSLNNIGCENADCRPAFRGRLKAFLKSVESELCDNCKRRMERNPLRVLDCKADGPKLKDRMPPLETCHDCRNHFERLQNILTKSGPDSLPIATDSSLVRGLDYYTRTVFEFKSKALGAQDALAGGGRYDNLVKSMGGPDTPAVGWAMGVERAMMAVAASTQAVPPETPQVYVAVQTPSADIEKSALEMLYDLRLNKVPADGGMFANSLKSQMREAERLGAKYAVIFGETEFKNGQCVVKNMKAKDDQKTLTTAEALELLLAGKDLPR